MKNNNEIEECKCKHDQCDTKKAEAEEIPKMMIFFENICNVPAVCRHMIDEVESTTAGDLFVLFESLGSVRLTIENPRNRICFIEDFVEIYADPSRETTLIQNDKLIGFVIEPHELVEDVE